jgi:hypothetical protein
VAILALVTLLSATVVAVLGRRHRLLPIIAALIAWGSLAVVRREDASLGILIAAYAAFGICVVASLSGMSGTLVRHNRAPVIAWIGVLLSLGLLSLAMWADVPALVIGAFGLLVIMFIVMVIVIVKWDAQNRDGTSTVG